MQTQTIKSFDYSVHFFGKHCRPFRTWVDPLLQMRTNLYIRILIYIRVYLSKLKTYFQLLENATNFLGAAEPNDALTLIETGSKKAL